MSSPDDGVRFQPANSVQQAYLSNAKMQPVPAKHVMFIPFQVDPSWYEKYWLREPAPDRTAYRWQRFGRRFYRACVLNRERLLRAADAMKAAGSPLAKLLSGKIGGIVSDPANRYLSNNKRN